MGCYLGKRILKWLADNILSIIGLILPVAVSTAASFGVCSKYALSNLELGLIIALCTIIIAIIIYVIWNAFSYKSYRYPYRKIRDITTYEILEKKIIYKRTSDDHLQFSRTMEIKSRSNRTSISDKYIWTGEQNGALKIIPVKGVSAIKEQSKIGIWRYIELELQNHIDKGETRKISYRWKSIEKCRSSSPFFSTSTEEPTKKLSLEVDLGTEYANQEIRCETFRALESDYPISTEVYHLDEQGRYSWNVPRIKRFRYYRVRWSWERGEPAVEMRNSTKQGKQAVENNNNIERDE